MSARETALNVLIACRREEGWSNAVLKTELSRSHLDTREAALATRLCYGVIQNRLKLDYYLQQLLTGKLKNLHPLVRDILHLGLYQILEMDRIPESAAVNESVILAKKYCKKQQNAPALVNGVLRNALRMAQDLQPPKSYVEKYSHPQKLVDLLVSYVGKPRMEKMLQANNAAPDTVIQVNTLLTSREVLSEHLRREGVGVSDHPWLSDCLVLSGTGSLEQLEAFGKGWFYVQDAAAKLSVLCAGIRPGDRVLDCCSAPGGKSFAAAICMNATGQITACDVHPHKIALIENGAKRLNLSIINAKVQDASQPVQQWVGAMDVVIADVPCSGYGIIRKKPDIRYKDPDSMKALPELQLAILNNQASYVKPGGTLLYSTCTLVRQENEGVVEAFLKDHPEFETQPLALPPVFPENTTGMLTLVPGEYDTDGFFFCRLRRKE